MDIYDSLKELKARESCGAWNQESANRGSFLTVVAPHGGTIEPLTEQLARDIAEPKYNLFIFEGLRPGGNDLHVTSHNFRDRELLELQGISRLTLSIHGLASSRRFVMVGGLNFKIRKRMIRVLLDHDFPAEQAIFPYAGEHPENFVNLTPEKGVQLEISAGEREGMCVGGVINNRYRDFVSAVRLVLADLPG
jgi:phage replication-related protein YjqB (UPF0714/DUF867 family)